MQVSLRWRWTPGSQSSESPLPPAAGQGGSAIRFPHSQPCAPCRAGPLQPTGSASPPPSAFLPTQPSGAARVLPELPQLVELIEFVLDFPRNHGPQGHQTLRASVQGLVPRRDAPAFPAAPSVRPFNCHQQHCHAHSSRRKSPQHFSRCFLPHGVQASVTVWALFTAAPRPGGHALRGWLSHRVSHPNSVLEQGNPLRSQICVLSRLRRDSVSWGSAEAVAAHPAHTWPLTLAVSGDRSWAAGRGTCKRPAHAAWLPPEWRCAPREALQQEDVTRLAASVLRGVRQHAVGAGEGQGSWSGARGLV